MVLSAGHKLRIFQLVFSDPARSFYSSGDKVSGSVLLEAAQPCKVTGLRVSAAGCARVEHRGGKNRRSRRQEVEYLKYEEELRLEEQLSRGTGPAQYGDRIYKYTVLRVKVLKILKHGIYWLNIRN